MVCLHSGECWKATQQAPRHRESGHAHPGRPGKTNRPLNILSNLGQQRTPEAKDVGESASLHLIALLRTPPRAFPRRDGKVAGFPFIRSSAEHCNKRVDRKTVAFCLAASFRGWQTESFRWNYPAMTLLSPPHNLISRKSFCPSGRIYALRVQSALYAFHIAMTVVLTVST